MFNVLTLASLVIKTLNQAIRLFHNNLIIMMIVAVMIIPKILHLPKSIQYCQNSIATIGCLSYCDIFFDNLRYFNTKFIIFIPVHTIFVVICSFTIFVFQILLNDYRFASLYNCLVSFILDFHVINVFHSEGNHVTFLGHLSKLIDILLSVFVRRLASCDVRRA